MEAGEYRRPNPLQEPIFKDTPEIVITQEEPKLLITHGFFFIGNRNDDQSIYEAPSVSLEAEMIARKIHIKGLQRKPLVSKREPKLTLREYILEAQEDGYEVRLKRGEYSTTAEHFSKRHNRIAVFRRFDLGRFFAPDINELTQAGYTIDKNETFDFIAWGDHLEYLPSSLILSQANAYNQILQDHVLKMEAAGYHVLFVLQPQKAVRIGKKLGVLIALYKKKPIP